MPVVFRTVFYPHVQSVVEVVVAKNKHDDKNQLRVQQPAKNVYTLLPINQVQPCAIIYFVILFKDYHLTRMMTHISHNPSY